MKYRIRHTNPLGIKKKPKMEKHGCGRYLLVIKTMKLDIGGWVWSGWASPFLAVTVSTVSMRQRSTNFSRKTSTGETVVPGVPTFRSGTYTSSLKWFHWEPVLILCKKISGLKNGILFRHPRLDPWVWYFPSAFVLPLAGDLCTSGSMTKKGEILLRQGSSGWQYDDIWMSFWALAKTW